MRIDDQNQAIAEERGGHGPRAARPVSGAPRRAICVLVLFLLLAPVLAVAEDAGQVPLIDAAGIENLLAAHRGKVVVLNFWATWCGPCRKELPHLMALRRAHSQDELYLAGISMDFDRRAVADFERRERPGYPLYFAGVDVPRAYGVGAVPKTMIWDPQGKLIDEHVGVADEKYLRQAMKRALGLPGGDED